MKENKDQDRIGSSYVPLDYMFVYVLSMSWLDIAFSGIGTAVSHICGVLLELPSGTRYAQKLCYECVRTLFIIIKIQKFSSEKEIC